jgi:O-antigen ligase
LNSSILSARNVFFFTFIMSIPFQDDMPTFAGLSISALLILVFGFIAFAQDSKRFVDLLMCPMSVAFYLHMAFCMIVESIHPYSTLKGTIRVSNMYLGAIVVAWYIESKEDIFRISNFYILSALLMSAFVVPFGWNILVGSGAATFTEADFLRNQIIKAIKISANVNNIAYTAMLGAVFCMFNIVFRKKNRIIHTAGAVLLVLCAFTSMSRSGLFNVLLALGITFIYFRLLKFKYIVYALVLLIGVVVSAPKAYVSRFISAGEVDSFEDEALVKQDSRSRTFNTSIAEIKKNWMWGVGEGNMFASYGKTSEFALYDESGEVAGIGGTHNLFFGTILHYGILGLIGFFVFVFVAITYLPRSSISNPSVFYLAMFGFSGFVLYFFMHDGANKEYSIIYGLLMGYHYHIRNKIFD